MGILFLTFLKIGSFAFGGGYAVLPLIEQFVVKQHAWLSMKELTDLVSLSQITPGPIAINSATFIGTKVAGIPGAIIATMGNVLPQFILMMVLGYFIFSGRKLRFLDHILLALKPAIVGLIAIATLSMLQSALWVDVPFVSIWKIYGIVGLLFGGYGYWKKWSVIQIVLVAVLIGLGMYALFPGWLA